MPAPKGSGRVPVISGRAPVWARAGTVPAPKRPGRVPVISGRVPVWARAGTVPAPEISGRVPAGSASRHAGFVMFYVPRARIFSIFCYSGYGCPFGAPSRHPFRPTFLAPFSVQVPGAVLGPRLSLTFLKAWAALLVAATAACMERWLVVWLAGCLACGVAAVWLPGWLTNCNLAG